MPGTIALRHLLLGLGCIAGVVQIATNWRKFSFLTTSLIPIYSIVGLFFWVVIHYLFFSLNQELELSEIKGLWARSLAGCIMATGFAIALLRNQHLRKYFYISIFSVPLINLMTYFYSCYLNGGLVHPNAFVKFYFAKIETAYFGGIAVVISIANIITLLSKNISKRDYISIIFFLLGIVLVLISGILSNTKNGIAIALGLCILLAIIVLVKAFLSFKGSKKVIYALIIFIIFLIGVVWQGHKSFAPKGWDTIFEDVKVAIQIDRFKQWQYMEGSVAPPLNSLGSPAALNTYSRFAYIAVGMRLIGQHPLGYGSINRSFHGMQDYANIYHEHIGQVHSGWVDFGLAFGLPGLAIVFLGLIATILIGLKSKGELTLIAVMYCIMVIPFGLIAEIAYKQYFEATLFFMAFSATIVALAPKMSAGVRA